MSRKIDYLTTHRVSWSWSETRREILSLVSKNLSLSSDKGILSSCPMESHVPVNNMYHNRPLGLIPSKCDKSLINIIVLLYPFTASLIYWLACLTTDHEVAGSIPGSSTNFK